MISRNVSPVSLDAAWFDQNYVDAKLLYFHSKGIAKSFNGIFSRVIPATHKRYQAATHR